MPNTNKQKPGANKKRLGRGLGSLLSTNMEDFEESSQPKKEAAPQKAVENPQQKQAPVKQALKKEVEKKTNPIKQENIKPQQAKPTLEPATKTKSGPEASPVPTNAIENKGLDSALRIWSLPIDKVYPNKTQPRKDFLKEQLQELADSIKEQGLLQPITVRKTEENYEIIAGERRWRASQLAGLHEVPAIIKNVDDQKSMELALIENLQRENLNPVEEAMAYQLLIDDYDLSQQEVAKKVGKDRTTVTNALRVLTLPRDVRQMVRQGLVSLGHAKVLVGVDDPKMQIKLARKTIQKKLSVRALEKEVKKLKKPEKDNLDSLDVSERLAGGLATDLQKVLGTKVNIQYKNGKGRIELNYYSDEELSNFCEKMKNLWHQNK
ncbi:MAG: ParB/RepB/Spo0J family partition protein [Bdellovibrionales bacterium]|nr:ParB/RepB/Spo0J family partition protein [Bdellovibrionales bacterium]NQZ17802.1 ParB/RepB/Spo0J family partition protein [Bdellovibrionales bacterium]